MLGKVVLLLSLELLQVSTEFLLLGLLSEEPVSKTGFYGSGITIDSARTAVDALQDRTRQGEARSFSVPNQELPFSRDSKRVFETAAAVSNSLLLLSSLVFLKAHAC